MHKYYLLFLLSLTSIWLQGRSTSSKDSIKVYIFLSDECVISQNYTTLLNRLNQEYGQEFTTFIGLFPNFASKPNNIEDFRKKYSITFPLKTDYFKTITKKMGATVTPEVVIFNQSSQEILYRGRIDDTYFRVGKRRTITTTSELEDALRAIQQGQPIAVKETDAVGCFINLREMEY